MSFACHIAVLIGFSLLPHRQAAAAGSNAPSIPPVQFEQGSDTAAAPGKAIERAVADAAQGGTCLLLPAGTYMVDTIDLSNMRSPCLQGQKGGGTILKHKPNAKAGATIVLSGTTGAKLSDLTIDGNKAQQSAAGYGLLALNVKNMSLSNLVVTGVKAAGGGGVGAAVSTTDDNEKSVIAGSSFGGNDGNGLEIDKRAQNVLIDQVKASLNGGAGIKIQNYVFPPQTAVFKNITISHTEASQNAGPGIAVIGFYTGGAAGSPVIGPGAEAADGITLSNLQISGNAKYGLVVQAAHASVSDITADGNHGGTAAGLLANAETSTFSRIRVRSNDGYGIDAGGCYKCVITGVDAGHNGGAGINIGGTWHTTLINAHAYGNGGSSGKQIEAYNYDFGGGSAFPYPTTALEIDRCVVETSSPDQIGVAILQNADANVHDCRFTGSKPANAFRFDTTSIKYANNTINGNNYVDADTGNGDVTVPDGLDNLRIGASVQGKVFKFIPAFTARFPDKVFAVVAVGSGGRGYTKATLAFGPGCAENPAGDVWLNSGRVVGVRLNAFGRGCTQAPAVQVVGDGQGAVLQAMTGAGATPEGAHLNVSAAAGTKLQLPLAGKAQNASADSVVAGNNLRLHVDKGRWQPIAN